MIANLVVKSTTEGIYVERKKKQRKNKAAQQQRKERTEQMSVWNKQRNFSWKCVCLEYGATIRNRIACHYSEKLLTTITLCNVFYGASFCFIPHYFRYFCAHRGHSNSKRMTMTTVVAVAAAVVTVRDATLFMPTKSYSKRNKYGQRVALFRSLLLLLLFFFSLLFLWLFVCCTHPLSNIVAL